MSNITIEGTTTVAHGQLGEPEGRRVRGRYPNARMQEAARLIQRVWAGDYRAGLELREALSTSDFGALFGATLDRMLLAVYMATPAIWQQFADRRVVRDFRKAKLFDILGGRAILPTVGELEEYKAREVTTGEFELQVFKRGARFQLSWETLINDDLDAFRDLPQRLAQAARNTEDYVATRLVEPTSGPDTAFFTGGTLLTGNPALTDVALEDALEAVAARKDEDGNPVIASNGYVLMVPQALEFTAQRIVEAREVEITEGSRVIKVGNMLSGRVKVVVNPWLTSATGWYVLPAPGGSRPAVVLGFLRGHEQPEIRVKADTGSLVGGGQPAPEDGSFDFDDVQYRARHVVGGTTAVNDAVIASEGDNT